MSDKPAAELEVGEDIVRGLLRDQATSVPGAATLPLRRAAEGWDCVTWRLGDELAVRLPRRAVAAALVVNEQRCLPGIARRLASMRISLPTPLLAGRPTREFPWPWSVVPWIPGESAIRRPRERRGAWAAMLARALSALHEPAARGFPRNPVRGVPLADRAAAVAARLESLHGLACSDHDALRTLEGIWNDGLSAPQWDGPPLWLHGDLHPGNLIVDGERLAGIVDFGDVTAGDPAYDLAVAWLAFDDRGRDAFAAVLRDSYDDAAWTRARSWAAAVTAMLLHSSDDNPQYARLGADALAELTCSPAR